jgi:Flp pilus assembly protein TadG
MVPKELQRNLIRVGMMSTGIWRHFDIRRLLKDRTGNFGIMTAIALPVLLAGGGVAVDVSNMVLTKGQMQAATDAAALATASALAAGTTDLVSGPGFGKDFVSGEMANYLGNNAATIAALKDGTTVVITPTTDPLTLAKIYSVNVTSSYSLPVNGMTHLLGWNTVNIGATSGSSSTGAVTSAGKALSMFLALDRSGSMSWVTDTIDTTQNKCVNYTEAKWPTGVNSSPCYISKISALKQAVGTLFDQLTAADPKNTLVRVGALSYTDSTDTGNPETIKWGTSSARTYVNSLPTVPTGGTDASGPMNTAYTSLTALTEASAQLAKGNATFSKYIVLMTDGENTGHSSTWDPSLDKKTLTTCANARAAGITIYTVAFMAPVNGQAMLQTCAGTLANYYEADDMADLIAAFKSIGQKASDQTTRLTN